MLILFFRIFIISALLYFAFRLMRDSSAGGSRNNGGERAEPRSTSNVEAVFDEDTLLTGFLRLQVVREKDAKPLSKQRVFFEAYAFG